ncbi:replication initiation factor domain-containing protein [Oceanobacillus sp. ISL-73]|nr:replication initiation factor domain-containing protein [Oceanobacillus sp. ISL-73]
MTTKNPPYSNRGVVMLKDEKNPLEAKIDYLRVSFKTHDVDLILNKVVHIKKEFMQHKESGFYGYVGTYQLDNIKVFYSHGLDNRGILVEMSGKGCRQFESFLEARKKTWYDFFQDCIDHQGKFPRLDVAIDDRKTYFDIPMALEKVKNGEAISRFRKSDYNGSLNIEDGGYLGTTIYFGSKQSEVYLCFYQKNYEQAHKYHTDVEEYGEWNRYELRIKNDRAHKAILEMLKTKNLLVIAKGIMNNYLRFVEKENSEERRHWKTSLFWKEFIGDVGKLKLYTDPSEDFYQKSKEWYLKYGIRTHKMIKMVDDTLGTTDLDDAVFKSELTPKQEHMLMVHLANIQEMVV